MSDLEPHYRKVWLRACACSLLMSNLPFVYIANAMFVEVCTIKLADYYSRHSIGVFNYICMYTVTLKPLKTGKI